MRKSHLLKVLLIFTATSHASVNEQVDKVFEGLDESTPGCSVAASRDGKVFIERSYGLANLEHTNCPRFRC